MPLEFVKIKDENLKKIANDFYEALKEIADRIGVSELVNWEKEEINIAITLSEQLFIFFFTLYIDQKNVRISFSAEFKNFKNYSKDINIKDVLDVIELFTDNWLVIELPARASFTSRYYMPCDDIIITIKKIKVKRNDKIETVYELDIEVKG